MKVDLMAWLRGGAWSEVSSHLGQRALHLETARRMASLLGMQIPWSDACEVPTGELHIIYIYNNTLSQAYPQMNITQTQRRPTKIVLRQAAPTLVGKRISQIAAIGCCSRVCEIAAHLLCGRIGRRNAFWIHGPSTSTERMGEGLLCVSYVSSHALLLIDSNNFFSSRKVKRLSFQYAWWPLAPTFDFARSCFGSQGFVALVQKTESLPLAKMHRPKKVNRGGSASGEALRTKKVE